MRTVPKLRLWTSIADHLLPEPTKNARRTGYVKLKEPRHGPLLELVPSTDTTQMDEMKESKRLAAEEKRKNAKPWF